MSRSYMLSCERGDFQRVMTDPTDSPTHPSTLIHWMRRFEKNHAESGCSGRIVLDPGIRPEDWVGAA